MRRTERRGNGVTHETLNLEDISKLDVMSIDEFCRWARISRASTYRCIKEGQLTAAKLRNRTIIRRDDALRFIAGLPPS